MRYSTRSLTHFTAVACLIAGGAPTIGKASSGSAVRTERLASQLPTREAGSQGGRESTGVDIRVEHVGRYRPHFTATGLRVAPSYFSPATLNSTYDYVEDNVTADKNPFAQDHSTTYENLGRVTGYYERADWTTPNGSQIFFRYQGSLMGSDALALAAQQDGTSHEVSAFSGQLSGCPNASPPPSTFPSCSYVATQDAHHITWFTDYLWAIGSCLVETEAQFPQALDTPTVNQVETTLSNFTFQARQQAVQLCSDQAAPTATATRTLPAPSASATSTPTIAGPTATSTTRPTSTAAATPTATKVTAVMASILSVRIEKGGARVDLSAPPLKVVKTGQNVQLAVYVQILQGAGGTPLSFTVDARQGSTSLVEKSVQDTVPATLPALLRETVSVQPSKQGRYTLTGILTVQGKSDSKSTVFDVGGSSKHQCIRIGSTRYCS